MAQKDRSMQFVVFIEIFSVNCIKGSYRCDGYHLMFAMIATKITQKLVNTSDIISCFGDFNQFT